MENDIRLSLAQAWTRGYQAGWDDYSKAEGAIYEGWRARGPDFTSNPYQTEES